MPSPPAIFFTDLDGTLIDTQGRIPPANLQALERLAREGIPRVVVTGRSLHGAQHTLGKGFPADYLIFSCGAGIYDWQRGKLLISHQLPGDSVARLWELLRGKDLSFMVHDPVPDNHRFGYVQGTVAPEDFLRRVERWKEFCAPQTQTPRKASQFLAVCDGSRGAELHAELVAECPDLTVVRATSPVDGRSTWLEFFPRHVSKGQGARWLAERMGVPASRTLAVGNDYNDLDLLEWAGTAYLVANAPAELKQRFATVAAFDSAGVADAVSRWMPGAGPRADPRLPG